MRGKAGWNGKGMYLYRITPAYAGKSRDRPSLKWRSWDHPRLCGEKIVVSNNGYFAMGSPPPMRGKVVWQFFQCVFNRITPAYAGKSLKLQLTFGIVRDHPRLCGEKFFSIFWGKVA